MVMNSPPVGAGAAPPSFAGIWIDLKPALSASLLNHDPFSAKAKSPVLNSVQLVPCVFWMTEFGARPFLTQSVQSVRAASAELESSLVRSAFAPQNHGRNWKLPSSVPTAEKVMPFLPEATTFCRAAFSDAQSFTLAMSTPAADSTVGL